jgi:pyruvate dehydrogenase E1 component alpha subunit
LGDARPADTVTATPSELLAMFELMYTMRRMEITCDNEYKARTIRGFCHLYDGQEAVATGIHTALNPDTDGWITSYRCHCIALARGASVAQIVGELFGHEIGLTKGKGGSMHFYDKAHKFYGGQGIVGAQVPVAAGLAFAAKYNQTAPGEPMAVAIGCYGDGAANQGQIWEAANMAALWKLPMIFCIENNQYGMGTSIDRHSSIQDYYKMGNAIPGLRIDGMNVLAVKEGMRFCKEWAGSGKGPIYVEMMTYRYHGHSMSDPGTTYRNREEIAFTRSTRDPLEFIKKCIHDAGFLAGSGGGGADEELKEIEKRIRKTVQAAVLEAKASAPPPMSDLIQHIFATNLEPGCPSELPAHIRMPNYQKSYWADGKIE